MKFFSVGLFGLSQRGQANFIVPAITTLLGLGGTILGKKNKSTTVTQEPLMTPEQEAARKMLLEYAQTGKYGDYTAGEAYSGDLGNYNLSGLETAGKSTLQKMLESGTPEMLALAKQATTDLLTSGKYDPYSATGEYQPFKTGAIREAQTAADTLARNASTRGRLSSKATVQEQGTLSENLANSLQGKLAELNDTYVQRKLSGINTAAGLASQEQNMNLQNVQQAYQSGAVERLLEDQAIKDKYNEWLRTRGEKASQLNAVNSLATTTIPWGSKSVTLPSSNTQSPWESVLNTGINMFGNVYGSNSYGSNGGSGSQGNSIYNPLNYTTNMATIH